MPDKDLVTSAVETEFAREFLALVLMLVGAVVARALIADDVLDVRRLIGETILSVIGAVGIYYAGILQDLSMPEIIFMGACMSLGMVRGVQWLTVLLNALRAQ